MAAACPICSTWTTRSAPAVIPDRLKIVDDVTWAPGPDDDACGMGVSVGSLWIDQDSGKVYLCRDATVGAAVWTDLTGGASTDVSCDNAASGLAATDVQAAIDELAAAIAALLAP